jgi:octaprenyl-diphosphate synthase
MGELSKIAGLVESDLDAFNKVFREALRGNAPLLNTIAKYMVRNRGKQIRPLFVLLSAGMHGRIDENAHRGAAMIELLHTATLIHDDVVDEAWQRRGLLSLNAVWRNKISVLMGDYILSRGLLLALNHDAFQQLKIVSDATREMSEGELMQIEKTRRLNITEDIYFEIIRKKTATLIAACCAIGAEASGASKDTINRMYLFGEKTGVAFQIKDDLFDYQAVNQSGKPSGTDLKEKKLTLPLIYTLRHCSISERMSVMNTIRFRRNDPKRISELYRLVEDKGGIEYARSVMVEYKDQALEILGAMHSNQYSEALGKLVQFTIDRNL